jgi:hypothetical protein
MARAAGWYQDPTNRPRLRYFDGERWTDRTADPVDADQEPARASTRTRWTATVVVAALVGVGLWKLVPWPDVHRERAINAVEIGVSAGGVPITREEAECVVEAAHARGVPYIPMENTDQLTDVERERLLEAAVECNVDDAAIDES